MNLQTAFAAALRDQQAGRLAEAVAAYRKLLRAAELPEIHFNLGVALRQLGQGEAAVASLRRAIALRPDYLAAHNNLGTTLRDAGRAEEAEACFRRVIGLAPALPEAHFNLGNALKAQGRLPDAAAALRQAIALRPGYVDAHVNLAVALLAAGDFAAGWPESEWRWQGLLRQDRRDFAQPLWHGEAADGRTLLIHAEQGFGDTLQFCRFAKLAAARGLRVVMEVQPPLRRLLDGLPGVDRMVARGETLPPFDLHCPTMSLPLALGTTLEALPSAEGDVRPDPASVAAWRARLPASGFRVGLVWAGNAYRASPAAAAMDRRRSIDPARLAPLLAVPGVQFVSLQKQGPAAPFPLFDAMAHMNDFADTAALIANLDLVISVDTAVAHLAAVLGKPVWLMNRFDGCWRWLAGRRDSPWYPTLRLYRQPARDAWEPVVAEIARDLGAAATVHAAT